MILYIRGVISAMFLNGLIFEFILKTFLNEKNIKHINTLNLNTMKAIAVSIVISILLMTQAHGQGMYFRLGGGYALPLASEVIGTKDVRTRPATGNQIYTSENVSGSFGAGMNINLGGGYMFNENIGFDLGVLYQRSKKYETIDNYYDPFGKEEDIITHQSTAIFFNPSFLITSGTGTKVPYGKFGVVVGSPKIKVEENYFYNLDGTETQHREWEYRKGMAFGFQGTVGMNWMLSNKLDLFTEINFVSMSFYPGEYELTIYTSNGTNVLPNLPVNSKKVEFVKQLDPNAPFVATSPRQELQEAKSFGALSFNVGIRFLMKGHIVD